MVRIMNFNNNKIKKSKNQINKLNWKNGNNKLTKLMVKLNNFKI